MKGFCSFCLALVAGAAMAQAHPVRIRVLHADPWFLKALFEGARPSCPEVSQMLVLGFPVMLATAQAAALFQGGRWIVNPTDNSLIWVPDKR